MWRSGDIFSVRFLDIIHDLENIIRNILTDDNVFSLRLLQIIKKNDLYYSDNYTGEVIRNWLHDSIVNKNNVK